MSPIHKYILQILFNIIQVTIQFYISLAHQMLEL